MSYEKYYQGGWKSGETGGTPITPEALNHMENGIETANKNLLPEPQEANNATFLRNDNTWQQVTPENIGAVPTSRTVNGRALSGNITLSASDVSAVPTTRTVNNKALSANITLAASDVGARPSTWTPTSADVGAVSKSGDTMTGTLYRQGGAGAIGLAIGTAEKPENVSIISVGDGTSSNRFSFRQYGSNGKRENYNLPDTTTPSANTNYSILTSKSSVTVAQGGTGATSAANARKNLGLEAFETKIVTNSSAKGLFQSVKDVFSSLSTNVVYVIRVSDTTPQRFAIGQKYGGNYGYFIGCTLDGLYYYRNYNGSWAEKAIATW